MSSTSGSKKKETRVLQGASEMGRARAKRERVALAPKVFLFRETPSAHSSPIYYTMMLKARDLPIHRRDERPQPRRKRD
jgi:hypothetical protein